MRTSSYTIYVDLPDNQQEMLLVHGYTGAYDRVSRPVASFLRLREAKRAPKPLYGEWASEPAPGDQATRATPPTSPSPQTLEILEERGFLTRKSVEEEVAFLRELAVRLHETRTMGMPGYIFMPTYNCNLRCPYCFQDHMRSKPQFQHLLKGMSIAMVDRILAGIGELEAKHGIPRDTDRPPRRRLFRRRAFAGGQSADRRIHHEPLRADGESRASGRSATPPSSRPTKTCSAARASPASRSPSTVPRTSTTGAASMPTAPAPGKNRRQHPPRLGPRGGDHRAGQSRPDQRRRPAPLGGGDRRRRLGQTSQIHRLCRAGPRRKRPHRQKNHLRLLAARSRDGRNSRAFPAHPDHRPAGRQDQEQRPPGLPAKKARPRRRSAKAFAARTAGCTFSTPSPTSTPAGNAPATPACGSAGSTKKESSPSTPPPSTCGAAARWPRIRSAAIAATPSTAAAAARCSPKRAPENEHEFLRRFRQPFPHGGRRSVRRPYAGRRNAKSFRAGVRSMIGSKANSGKKEC